jgi:hypothetical protein
MINEHLLSIARKFVELMFKLRFYEVECLDCDILLALESKVITRYGGENGINPIPKYR